MSDTEEPDVGDRKIFSNWVCTECGTLNMAHNEKCIYCGNKRP